MTEHWSENEEELAQMWLQCFSKPSWKDEFDKNGCLVVCDVIDEKALAIYRAMYDNLMTGVVDASSHRQDLGKHAERQVDDQENISQIMWPSLYVQSLISGPAYQRLLRVVKAILGEDMAFDFDMLIEKAPYSNTPTPWHQDESYWPDMPDKRAASCWVALDDATVDNGCMWFVPGSHREGHLRKHRRVKEGFHLRITDDCSEEEGTPYPIKAGSCTLHHGRMLHYTRGNSTSTLRRAYIMNFRPQAMIDWERERGWDHGRTLPSTTQHDQV